jgi:hypothetical protein
MCSPGLDCPLPIFHVIKNVLHHRKNRYRGLTKNTHQFQMLFALTNVFTTRMRVMAMVAGLSAPVSRQKCGEP